MLVEQLVHELHDVGAQALDGARREGLRDKSPQPCVVRRVQEQQRAAVRGELEDPRENVEMAEALPYPLLAVRLLLAETRVAQGELAFLVAGAHDETHTRAVHRRRFPQLPVPAVGILPPLGRADRLQEERVELWHLGRPTPRPSSLVSTSAMPRNCSSRSCAAPTSQCREISLDKSLSRDIMREMTLHNGNAKHLGSDSSCRSGTPALVGPRGQIPARRGRRRHGRR